MNNFLTNLNSLPELLETSHLVQIGLYPSIEMAYLARKTGQSPDYFRMGRKYFYPKAKVIEFISSRLKNGSQPQRS